jgi:hypothetical protein
MSLTVGTTRGAVQPVRCGICLRTTHDFETNHFGTFCPECLAFDPALARQLREIPR